MLRKKLTLSLLLICGFFSVSAQNLQIHYDYRHSIYKNELAPSNFITTTFEMFKPDEWGSTFMFIDANFGGDKYTPNLMYAEIARDFKINNFILMPHLEYNGGFVQGVPNAIPNSYLAGASYPFQVKNVFFSTYLAYKLNSFAKSISHDAQWTVTWTTSLCNDKLTLSGFADLWTENKDRTGVEAGKKFVFIAEPQIWYNLTSNLSVGGEVELTAGFYGSKFYVCPTTAIKWNF